MFFDIAAKLTLNALQLKTLLSITARKIGSKQFFLSVIYIMFLIF